MTSAMRIEGEFGEAEPHCVYMAKVKLKLGPCGEVCASCPYATGDQMCKNIPCEGLGDCPIELKGFAACGKAACKVLLQPVGCEPCWPDCD